MNPTEADFGSVDSIDAEAIGRPGDRRFRLVAVSGSRSASIWMEKVQLAGIAEWFDEMATRLGKEDPPPGAGPLNVAPVPGSFELEFRAGQLGLGYLEEERRYTIQAFDVEAGGSARARGRPAFSCQVSQEQAGALSTRISELVAAGRAMCPLCQAPMDPGGHVCPRSNGHETAARI